MATDTPNLLDAASQRPFAVQTQCPEIMQMCAIAPCFMSKGIKRPNTQTDFVALMFVLVLLRVDERYRKQTERKGNKRFHFLF
jgi:hypothetical protein